MRSSLVTTVTSKGQVTIPAEVHRHLGIQAGDKVSFTIEDGSVRVSRVEWTLETYHRVGEAGEATGRLGSTHREAKRERVERKYGRR